MITESELVQFAAEFLEKDGRPLGHSQTQLQAQLLARYILKRWMQERRKAPSTKGSPDSTLLLASTEVISMRTLAPHSLEFRRMNDLVLEATYGPHLRRITNTRNDFQMADILVQLAGRLVDEIHE